jgi:hypothetical protein
LEAAALETTGRGGGGGPGVGVGAWTVDWGLDASEGRRIDFWDMSGRVVSSATLCVGGGGGIGVGTGAVPPVAPPTVGVLDAFGVTVPAAGDSMLRTTEAGPVSESGGGGGGTGVGGEVASTKVVEEATFDMTEDDLLAAFADTVEAKAVLFELNAALDTMLAAVSPLLRTLVHRRPWKVVVFDAMQTAVQSACGANSRVYRWTEMGVAQA